jgi:hypothetical protein
MTPEDAEELSRAAQEVQMPLHLRPANYGTTHTFAWIEHPTDPALVVLEIPEGQNIPVHAQANREKLDRCLDKLKARDAATQEEVDAVKDIVGRMRSSQVAATEVVPETMRNNAPKTKDEAIAAGLMKREANN